jgi:putative DeoR family transcriptional regulator (stage III sporulation protein D)
MQNTIKERVLTEANYILKTKYTIREVGKIFKVSKSTVHKDVSFRLKKIDINLYNEVQKIMKYHTSIRHIKGGESTKKKYQKNKR